MRPGFALLAGCIILAACGGDDDVDTSRSAFVEWLTEEGGTSEEDAECVADALYDDLSSAEVEEFVTLDAGMSEEEFEDRRPARLDDYTDASVDCALDGVRSRISEE